MAFGSIDRGEDDQDSGVGFVEISKIFTTHTLTEFSSDGDCNNSSITDDGSSSGDNDDIRVSGCGDKVWTKVGIIGSGDVNGCSTVRNYAIGDHNDNGK